MSEQGFKYLICQCGNNKLCWIYKENGKLTKDKIKEGIEKAKNENYCYEYKIDKKEILYFKDGEWYSSWDKYAYNISFFCKCGKYSLDYKDLIKKK